jgi:hypothetical protein
MPIGRGVPQLRHATMVAPCLLTLRLFRSESRSLSAERPVEANAEPGPFRLSAPVSQMENAEGLLVTAGGTEYHLHPFLSPRQCIKEASFSGVSRSSGDIESSMAQVCHRHMPGPRCPDDLGATLTTRRGELLWRR